MPGFRRVPFRRLARWGLVLAAIAVGVGVVAAEGLGDGALRSTAVPDDGDVLMRLVDPPRFAKQVQLGPERTPAATPDSGGRAAAGTSAGGGSASPAAPAPQATAGGPPPSASPPAPAEAPAAPSGLRCVVRLHGKGGGGSPSYTGAGGVVEVAPSGNGAAWGGREWAYFPESGYVAARAAVLGEVEAAGCGRVILDGFSNGGAFAAKLYCRGETLGGRLVGVIVDDPVVDRAVEGCRPAAGVRVVLYWTGALDATATPGWDCSEQDWTCEGGITIGVDAYQRALGVTRKQSAHTSHTWYQSPPELSSWW